MENQRQKSNNFLDKWAEICFKTDRDGTLVFYPWGVLGKGCVVPDEERKRAILKYLRRYMLIMFGLFLPFVLGIALAINAGFSYLLVVVGAWLAIFIISCIWYQWSISKLTQGFSVSETPFKVSDSYRATAQLVPSIFLWFGLVLCLKFALFGAIFFIWDLTHIFTIFSWLWLVTLILFGLFSIPYFYMIRVKLRGNNS